MTTRSGRDDRDHVADADAEVATDAGEPLDRLRVAGPGGLDRGLDGVRPARLGDPVGARERLEAAVVAAVARRTVGIDDLVADLAGRAVMPQVDVAIDGDDAADPGPKGQPDHRVGAAAGPEAQLGESERASVVDEGDRQAERLPTTGAATATPFQLPGMFTRNRVVPVAGSYSPGTPIPSDAMAGHRSSRRSRGLGDPPDDRVGSLGGARRHLARGRGSATRRRRSRRLPI